MHYHRRIRGSGGATTANSRGSTLTDEQLGELLSLIKGADSVQAGAYGGRNLHFGIREHGMGAIVNGLTLGCVYAVVALGYTMVYGIIQLINFAHGEVVMIGCMVAFSVIVALAGTAISW